MNYFKYQISTIIFILLAVQINFGQGQIPAENRDSRLVNLKKQAEMLLEAQGKNDFEKTIELTHPQVIEKTGGKEKYIAIIQQVSEQIPKYFEFFSTIVENATELVKLEENLFGVVPLRIEAMTLQKDKITGKDCIVGVSNDNGTTWKFVSGERFHIIFPSAKDKLQIFKRKIFVNGIEQ